MNNKFTITIQKVFTITNHLISKAIFSVIILSACGLNSNIQAQEVRHPLSEISTNAKHYSYTYLLSETSKKELEYFIVKSPDGVIKTAFDACDVCYQEHKGYSQNGEKMRCNNCGNQYDIDALGTQGQGGCWPGYLPHTIDGEDIVINISDLQTGAYFFKTQIVSDVKDLTIRNLPYSYLLTINNKQLHLNMPVFSQRTINVYSINGNNLLSVNSSNADLSFDISNLASGLYIITITENNNIFRRLFAI